MNGPWGATTGPVRGAAGRTGAPRRPRFPRRPLEVRPLESRCGTRPTPTRLDWPPGRWPAGRTTSTWTRTSVRTPADAIDRGGPTDEPW